MKTRTSLCKYTSRTFENISSRLCIAGHFLTKDLEAQAPNSQGRKAKSLHAHDEAFAVGYLLRISAQLTSGSLALFKDRRSYAAAALLRQLVEVEYLAWAFENRNNDAERWLQSTKLERQTFFQPRKLRAAAKGKFRSHDYGFHCELGGHPVPGADALLANDVGTVQLLLADLLGHTGRIWDHVHRWSKRDPLGGQLPKTVNDGMVKRYMKWKSVDALAHLPPPPIDE